MKNISIVLNVILAIAIVVLYVLHFSGKKSNAGDTETQVLNLDNPVIAYVNTDSVMSKYDLFQKYSKEFEEKSRQAEANLQSRAEGLQREARDLQSNSQNMTINQIKALQESLRQKEQNLMMYEQSLRQQLMQEEAKITNELYDKLSAYLDDYGRKNNIHLVLTYTRGSGVLFANDSLNITPEVIKGLNEQFASEEAGQTVNGAQPKDTTATK